MIDPRPCTRARRLVLALGVALTPTWGPPARAADPPPVVEVSRGPLVSRLSFHGELEAARSVPIHAPDIADLWYLTIETVLPDGEAVHKGDVVMTFRSGELSDELNGLKSNVLVAEAEKRSVEERLAAERIDLELELSRREMQLERARLMVVEGVNLISKVELEKARLDVSAAELEVARAKEALSAFGRKRDAQVQVEALKLSAAQRQLKERESALSRMKVEAPADGVIFAPFVQLNDEKGKAAPGKVVRPGSKLLELPDLTAFQAHLYVRQRDAALLQPGDRATLVLTARPELALGGKVVAKEAFATTRNERLGTKSPEGNLKEIHVTLDVTLPQGPELAALRPGATLRAEIESSVAADVVRVPLAAVTESAVTLETGERRAVKLGRATAHEAEVLEGLSGGERVRLGAPAGP